MVFNYNFDGNEIEVEVSNKDIKWAIADIKSAELYESNYERKQIVFDAIKAFLEEIDNIEAIEEVYEVALEDYFKLDALEQYQENPDEYYFELK